MNSVFGTDSSRFSQVHSVVYFVGIVIFLIFFIVEQLTGLVTRMVDSFCCCLRRDENLTTFSCDLLHELSSEDLFHEYESTVASVRENNIFKHKISEDNEQDLQMAELFDQQLILKQKKIIFVLQNHLKSMGIRPKSQQKDSDANIKTDFVKL